jgi:hypothetical protein
VKTVFGVARMKKNAPLLATPLVQLAAVQFKTQRAHPETQRFTAPYASSTRARLKARSTIGSG